MALIGATVSSKISIDPVSRTFRD
jgi:endoglycosylceramidase